MQRCRSLVSWPRFELSLLAVCVCVDVSFVLQRLLTLRDYNILFALFAPMQAAMRPTDSTSQRALLLVRSLFRGIAQFLFNCL